MENNFHTFRYAEIMVRLVYLTQVTRIETDYWFPLPAQNDKMLEVIQLYERKMLSIVTHI